MSVPLLCALLTIFRLTGKPASGHCTFKVTTTDTVIYFRAKSQSVCETWVQAIATVLANITSPAVLSGLPVFDGGAATRARSPSIHALLSAMTQGRPAQKDSAALLSSRHVASGHAHAAPPPVAPDKTHGTLVVKVLRGTELGGSERSDPYCRISIDGYGVATHACAATSEPVWNQTFNIPFNRSIVCVTPLTPPASSPLCCHLCGPSRLCD